jgi:hypothetical protein
MKKNLKKIEFKKQTISLLDQSTILQMQGGNQLGLTRIIHSCHKSCPTLQPDCDLSIQPNCG